MNQRVISRNGLYIEAHNITLEIIIRLTQQILKVGMILKLAKESMQNILRLLFLLLICVLQILQVVAKMNLPLLVHAQKPNGAPVLYQGASTNVRDHGMG